MNRDPFGFTVVELLVVIILLTVLAASALPRFLARDDDAYALACGGAAAEAAVAPARPADGDADRRRPGPIAPVPECA